MTISRTTSPLSLPFSLLRVRSSSKLRKIVVRPPRAFIYCDTPRWGLFRGLLSVFGNTSRNYANGPHLRVNGIASPWESPCRGRSYGSRITTPRWLTRQPTVERDPRSLSHLDYIVSPFAIKTHFGLYLTRRNGRASSTHASHACTHIGGGVRTYDDDVVVVG